MIENIKLIQELNNCWEFETGFFYKLREGQFNEELYGETLAILKKISLSEGEPIPKDLVRLLWLIPTFMDWQTERVSKSIDLKIYSRKITAMQNELERIFGMP